MPSLLIDSPRSYRRIQVEKKKFMAKGATVSWLSDQLSRGAFLLLLDCRPFAQFVRSHVRGAINLTIPSLMLRRLKKGTNFAISSLITSDDGKAHFNRNLVHASGIVLYDSETSDLSAVCTNSALGVLLKKFTEDVNIPIWLLEGGFTRFERKYSSLCEAGEDVESPLLSLSSLTIQEHENHCQPLKIEPSTPQVTDHQESRVKVPVQILPHLYLGSEKDSSDLELLTKYGISYILNVTHDKPNSFEHLPGFKYKKLPVEDNWRANLSDMFPEAFEFIDEGITQNRGVLIHCLGGVSRSVTVIIAYLISTLNMTLNEAYDFVKQRKPSVNPNLNFMGQLLEFERQLRTVGIRSPQTPSSTTSTLSSDSSLDSD
ncbi:dual specificity protein phosphatase 7-like [Montipora foliosa]|uniref:dual specificity protein phosphatase 7-like n=1 Tax=Montipora foliosa TaxID=591990 RepID=UPI0035F1B652